MNIWAIIGLSLLGYLILGFFISALVYRAQGDLNKDISEALLWGYLWPIGVLLILPYELWKKIADYP